MATFWERAAHSVNRVFSLYFAYCFCLVISHFGFEGGTLVLIASVPGHCLSFTLHTCGSMRLCVYVSSVKRLSRMSRKFQKDLRSKITASHNALIYPSQTYC